MSALTLALALLVGLSLGMLGGGGSILTVPIFVYVSGFSAKSAVAMSLPVVAATSLVGAVSHWRDGHVVLRAALAFGLAAMVAAYVGARLAIHVSGDFQLILLAVVMLVAAGAMFRPRREVPPTEPDARPALMPLVAAGAGVGVLTGLVGIGGGFLAVPALAVFGGLRMKEAVGTSLVVIAMNASAGLLGYLGAVPISWTYVAWFTAVAAVGILVGARLARRVRGEALRRMFAVFLILMGVFILVQRLGLFHNQT